MFAFMWSILASLPGWETLLFSPLGCVGKGCD